MWYLFQICNIFVIYVNIFFIYCIKFYYSNEEVLIYNCGKVINILVINGKNKCKIFQRDY